jgi:REP element-mobilizing transposase RayT
MRPILAYHVVFTAYGFWLPNDPRGSGSAYVWAKHLRRFGPPSKVTTRRSVAAKPHDASHRRAAKQSLLRPQVQFSGLQARAVAAGFADVAVRLEAKVHAAAVLPDHVHLVLVRGPHRAEDWVGFFKRAASRALRDEGLHPFAAEADDGDRVPSVWADGGWKVYLHDAAEIRRAVEYVEQNPVRAGFKPQTWSFVTPYTAPRGRGG